MYWASRSEYFIGMLLLILKIVYIKFYRLEHVRALCLNDPHKLHVRGARIFGCNSVVRLPPVCTSF